MWSMAHANWFLFFWFGIGAYNDCLLVVFACLDTFVHFSTYSKCSTNQNKYFKPKPCRGAVMGLGALNLGADSRRPPMVDPTTRSLQWGLRSRDL